MELRSDNRIPSARKSPSIELPKKSKSEILFICPELDSGVHPKHVWKEKVIRYIANKRALDRVRACIVAIKTFNSESEICYSLRVLRTYVSNLIEHPNEPKYTKIRSGNACIQKLNNIVGAVEFLQAIGFKQVGGENKPKEESFLVHVPNDKMKLSQVLQELDSVRGFTLSLFRNVVFIEPNTDPVAEEPDDFYEWTIEDMEREYRYRTNRSESNQRLRTKKMREVYIKSDSDYTIIRVRFPDAIVIQATFSTKETLADLKNILRKNMEISGKFMFVLPPSKWFTEIEENKTFLELDLFPSITLLVRLQLDPSTSEQFY
ncbi:UBX domain-containing protein 6 isoform X2 [Halyomorpha halys]|nr:uncharacterized protein LOC106678866 isoform X2 [Halyomorpha halys]